MAGQTASPEFRRAVLGWNEAPLPGKSLVFFSHNTDADIAHHPVPTFGPEGIRFDSSGIERWLAVFAIAASDDHGQEYVVIVDDWQGEDVRSWTVADELVGNIPERQYYMIPGPEWRDDVVIPYPGAPVTGGLGNTTMEMSPTVWLHGIEAALDQGQ